MDKQKGILDEVFGQSLDRRSFLVGSAAVGCAALVGSSLEWQNLMQKADAGTLTPADEYKLNQAERTIYTVCLNCNTGCGVKAKIADGGLVKVDGNPYSPWTMMPHLDYNRKVQEAARIDGAICPKGQASLQIYYDPYRIRKVLKRAGKRGENKWVTVPFDQAVNEIVNGGKLFAKVPGEENREVEGLKSLYAVKDPKVMKDMGDAVSQIWAEKDKAKKQALVQAFQQKFKEHLGAMIDPAHPDFGPKNNQFCFWWGRLKDGRGDIIKRFTLDSMGSTNAHGHTTVCQGSLYFTGKAMSEQWRYDAKKNAYSWTGGQKFYWQGELEGAEFVIFVGANVFEANYGPPMRTQRITEGVSSGRLKYAVIDPVYRKATAHAWKWVPVKPGRDAAIALGMIRWILDNKKYDAKYLSCANKAAAKAAGEPTWCNASWLVKLVDGKPRGLLKGQEAGLPDVMLEKDGKSYRQENFVAMSGGQPAAVDPYDEKTAVNGDLFYQGEVNGIKVKTALQILLEEAASKSIAEWAKEADVKPADLEELAREFTSHGKKAVVDIHRGVSQHTSGYYNVLAWNTLNLLIGNLDHRGGFIKLSTFSHRGDKAGQSYNVSKHPKKLAGFGLNIIRAGTKYEDTTIFNGYPAKRAWFPLASDIHQEVATSAGDQYPYQLKCLIMYMNSAIYSVPSGQGIIDALSDPKKLPLVISSDIMVGETSLYADYIFPDLTYLERWEFHGSHPNIPFKVQPVRQPAAIPLTETVKVFGQEMPCSIEALLLALAEKMNLPGFGPDGFDKGVALSHFDHQYLKQVANIATDGKAVPDADDEEVKIFLEARKHLPKTVFDPERWKAACGGEKFWRKVIYVLNRGGRFEEHAAAWDGTKVKNKYGTYASMYCEKTATTRNAMNGQYFNGIATYVPDITDCTGKKVDDSAGGYDLTLLTGKTIQHTKSRTNGSYWLLALEPENGLKINPVDAKRLGFKDGDRVKVVSATNPDGVWKLGALGDMPIAGKLQVTEGIRPGVVDFSLGSGHFASGSRDVSIDGQVIKGDGRRGKGIHANAVMRADPLVKNTGLQDVIGGSIVFYDTQVKLVRV